MRIISLALLIMAVSISIPAQKVGARIVSASSTALSKVPQDERMLLVKRMNEYLYYLHTKDLEKLYELTASRKKSGLNKEEFIKVSRVESEGEIIKFKITKFKKAELDEYSDEPLPGPGEGEKWFVTGLARVREKDGKARKYAMGFDVWLTDGQWYINRGGRLLNSIE